MNRFADPEPARDDGVPSRPATSVPARTGLRRELDVDRTGGATAVAAAVANLLALAGWLLWIRPGLADDGSRIRYLMEAGGRWTAGWILCAVATSALLLTCIVLIQAREPFRQRLARLAVGVGAIGLALELAGDVIALLTPQQLASVTIKFNLMAAHRDLLDACLHRLDRLAAVIGGFAGTGLFAVAGIVLSATARRARAFAGWLDAVGLVAWSAAVALAVSSLAGWTNGIRLLAPSYRAAVALWAFGVGTVFFHRRHPLPAGTPPDPPPDNRGSDRRPRRDDATPVAD
jgi:hypothetical protein